MHALSLDQFVLYAAIAALCATASKEMQSDERQRGVPPHFGTSSVFGQLGGAASSAFHGASTVYAGPRLSEDDFVIADPPFVANARRMALWSLLTDSVRVVRCLGNYGTLHGTVWTASRSHL